MKTLADTIQWEGYKLIQLISIGYLSEKEYPLVKYVGSITRCPEFKFGSNTFLIFISGKLTAMKGSVSL